MDRTHIRCVKRLIERSYQIQKTVQHVHITHRPSCQSPILTKILSQICNISRNEKNLQVKTFFRILVRIYSFSRQVRAGVRSVRGYTIPSPGDLFHVFQLTILNPTKEGLIAGTTSTWTTGRHSLGHRFCFPFNLIRDYGRSFRPARIVEKRLGVSKESGCEKSSPGIPE